MSDYRKLPEDDYLDRTIETIRNHRDCWPQWVNIFADEIKRLRKRATKTEAALAAIAANAESWHGDDAAKGRALAVIAGWARNPTTIPPQVLAPPAEGGETCPRPDGSLCGSCPDCVADAVNDAQWADASPPAEGSK